MTERHRREERDPRRKGTWVEPLWERHADRLTGDEVRKLPREIPPAWPRASSAGRNSARRKVDVLEIGPEHEAEIAHLCHSGIGKRVGPCAEAARSVLHVEGDRAVRRGIRGGGDLLGQVAGRTHRSTVERELEVVEQGVRGGQDEVDTELAPLGVGVAEPVRALERDGVGGVPQQPLATMFQVEIDRRTCRLQSRGHPPNYRFAYELSQDASVPVLGFHGFRLDARTVNPGCGCDLAMRPAPQKLHVTLEAGIVLSGAREKR